MIFGRIFKIAKNWIWPKIIFLEIDLFDFTSFFGQDFFEFSGLLWIVRVFFRYAEQCETTDEFYENSWSLYSDFSDVWRAHAFEWAGIWAYVAYIMLGKNV